MDGLTYDNLVDKLLETVPDIRAAFQHDKELLGDDYLPHLVFGDNLYPYLKDLLLSDGDEATIQQIFRFLEMMATSDDERILSVLVVAVCESLSGHSPELLAKARSYMGDATRQWSHEIAVARGHELPYDDGPPEIKAMAPDPRPPRDSR